MRAVIQRVRRARVCVGEEVVSSIGLGFLVLLGVEHEDGESDAAYVVEKISGLRVFEDGTGKMNLSLLDVRGEVLVVSQFTLLGDCRKGRRPSFIASAAPDLAESLYSSVVRGLESRGHPTATGRFRADMDVELVNEGPVTILLDSRRRF